MNHLHEMLDQFESREVGVNGEFTEFEEAYALRLISQARSQAVCFDIGPVVGMAGPIPDPALYQETPFPVCWFEFEDEGITWAFLTKQSRDSETGRYSFTAILFSRDALEIPGNPSGKWTVMAMFPAEGASLADLFGKSIPKSYGVDPFRVLVTGVRRFVSIINCKNVHLMENSPPSKLQKKRAKKGKTPLFSYWTLHLRGRGENGEEMGGTHESPRVHLRRGHPRQYAPGKWTWVQPCVVGNPERGMVHKDYAASPDLTGCGA